MRKIFTLAFIGLFAMSHAQTDRNIFLIARNLGEKIIASGDTLRVFGFAENLSSHPGVPGPTLYANEGDSVHIDMWNVSQGAPHTIHLHGLDVDQQNDGVPHLSFDVPHMEHGYYHFKAPHPGTYLYHCHVASTIHVQAGMYGLIIIHPKDGSNTTWTGGYEYTNEYPFFVSEIDVAWHADSVLAHEHDTSATVHTVQIPKYDPQFFLINGLSDHQLVDSAETIEGNVNQVDYLRFANIGYYGLRVIFPSGLRPKIVASDGRPLPSVEESDTLLVFPGERYGVLIEPEYIFNDNLVFEYFDLNTEMVRGVQVVPVNVEGYYGIQEIDHQQVNVYPNPAINQLNISSDIEISRIRIIDLNGRVIMDQNGFHPQQSTIVIEELPQISGTYVLELITKDGAQIFKRFIILGSN